MNTFDPKKYTPAIDALLEHDRLPELGPGRIDESVRSKLESATFETLFAGFAIVDKNMTSGCLCGLWLWYDFLNESHSISQKIETTTGSYWHAIMHRREPDYSNAKYWFRRVGDHPMFGPLLLAAQTLAGESDVSAAETIAGWTAWDPFGFVDLCQQSRSAGPQEIDFLQHVARCEWQLLFDHCFERATGKV